jgi:hypothetical protein
MGTNIGSLTGEVSIDDQVSGALDTILSNVTAFGGDFVDAFGAMAVGVGLVTAALGGMTAAIVELGNEGSKVEDVSAGFEHFAGSAQNASDILDAMRTGVRGTVDDLTLMTNATKLMGDGVKANAADFGTLTQVSMVLAKEGFGTVEEVMNQVDRAMLTGNASRLGRIGLTVDTKAAETAYAESLGVTASQLTKEGKLTADRNALLAAATAAVQKAGTQNLTFADQMNIAVTAVENWGNQLALAVSTSPYVQAALDAIGTALVDNFGGDGQTAIQVIVGWVNKFADEVTQDGPIIIKWAADTWDEIQKIWTSVKGDWAAIPDWVKSIGAEAIIAGAGIYVVVTAFTALGGLTVISTVAGWVAGLSSAIFDLAAMVTAFGAEGFVVTITGWIAPITAVIASIGEWATSMSFVGEAILAVVTGPIGLIVGAVTLLIAGMRALTGSFSFITTPIKDVWQVLTDLYTIVTTFTERLINDLWPTLTKVGGFFSTMGGWIKDQVVYSFDLLVVDLKNVVIMFEALLSPIQKAIDKLHEWTASYAGAPKEAPPTQGTIGRSADLPALAPGLESHYTGPAAPPPSTTPPPQVTQGGDAFSKMVKANQKSLDDLQAEITSAQNAGVSAANIMDLFGSASVTASEKAAVFGNTVGTAVKGAAADFQQAALDKSANAAAIAIQTGLAKSFDAAASSAQKDLSQIGFNYKGLQTAGETAQAALTTATETGTALQVDTLQAGLDKQLKALGATPDQYNAVWQEESSDYQSSLTAQITALNDKEDAELTALTNSKDWAGKSAQAQQDASNQVITAINSEILAAQNSTSEKIKAIGPLPDAYKQTYDKTTDVVKQAAQIQIDAANGLYDTVAELEKASGVQTVQDMEATAEKQYGIYVDMKDSFTEDGVAMFTGPQIEAARQKWLKAQADAAGTTVTTWEQSFSQIGSAFSTMGSAIGGTLGSILSEVGKVASGLSSIGTDIASGNWLGAVAGIVSLGASLWNAVFGLNATQTALQNLGVTVKDQLFGDPWFAQQTEELKELQGQVPLTQASLQDLFSGIDAGGTQATNALKTLTTLLPEIDKNATEAASASDELMKTYAAGGPDATQALTDINTQVTDFQAQAATTGGVWSSAFQNLIQQSQSLGQNIDSINKALATQISNASTGITAALGVTSDAYTKLAADQATVLTSTSATAVATAQADLQTQQGIIDATQIKTQQQASGVAASIVAIVDANMKAGQSFVDAFKGAGPAITSLQAELDKTGFSGGQAFDFLNQEVKLATGTISGPAITSMEGFTAAAVGLGNAGALTQDSFAGLEDQIGTTYDTLIAQGASGQAALAAMQPDLQSAWELEQQFGVTADAATQNLINQGVQSGIVGEKQKSSTQQMIDALNDMDSTLKLVAESFTGKGGLLDQAQTAAAGIQKSFDGITGPTVTVTTNYATQGSAPAGQSPAPGSDTSNPGQQPPALGVGAFVHSPMLAIVGDAPGGEWVVPAGPNTSSPLPAGFGTGGGGDTYINLTNSFIDAEGAEDAALVIAKAIIAAMQANRGGTRTQMRAALHVS